MSEYTDDELFPDDLDNLPIDCSSAKSRDGFVWCKECHYCNPVKKGIFPPPAINKGATIIGQCMKNPISVEDSLSFTMTDGSNVRVMSGNFPVVRLRDGCFSGRKLTTEDCVLYTLEAGDKGKYA